ncbi:MAG: neutral/alkaline non-lysosomal ceramidase N-terminal domain-containing protein [Pirellulaceae bacterium]
MIRSLSRYIYSLLIGLMLCSTSALFADEMPPALVKAELGETPNVHRCGRLFLAGQPELSDLDAVRQAGVEKVIFVRMPGELTWDVNEVYKQRGFGLTRIPIQGPDTLTDEVFETARKSLRETRETTTLLHCGSATRVSAVWFAYRVLDQNVPIEQALAEAKRVSSSFKAFEQKAVDYVRRMQQTGTKQTDKAETQDGSLRAAAGTVSITPDEPVWMAGYAGRDKPSEGKVHDLFAKVLVVEDAAGKRLAIVTLDLIGITPELRSAVEASAETQGIEAADLMMNASHTHCGPELRGDRLVRFGIDPKYAALSSQYVRQTAERIGKLIAETSSKLEASRLFYSYARAGFAMNRRLPTDNGFINSPNPDGPVDHRVPVLRVVDSEDKVRAILFGYSCHNTTLGFNQLCGDYAGFAQEDVEQAHPGAVAMFVNGCSADQNPYPRRTLELARQHGRALANGVETALETKLFQEVRGPIRSQMETVTLEFAKAPTAEEVAEELQSSNRYARFHGEAMQQQLDKLGQIPTSYDNFPLQVIQFGDDLTLVAICGEVVVDYALRLEHELSGPNKPKLWVAGYSNYVFGYLPSRRVLQEGGYEGGGAMLYTTFPGAFADDVEERVIDKVRQMVGKVRDAEVE